jgi:CRISPR/Cas system-associated exonuclease Cas4 (RecB family)
MTNPAKLAVVPDRETREKAERFLDRIEQARALRNPAPAAACVESPRFTDPKPFAPTDVLSPSSVNQWVSDCQAKWFYKRVLGLPDKRSSALAIGSAIHTAMAANFRQKLETKQDLPTEGVTAIYRDELEKELTDVSLEKGETAADLRECGEVMTRVYMAECAPRIQPAAVEKPVRGLIGDVPVQGFIDVIDTAGAIVDLKTASKKPAGIHAGYRLQVATYAMLEPTASGRARLDTLTKTRTVALHGQTVEVTDSDRKQATRLYSIAREQMQTGLYIPNRSSHLCSRKYCAFWERCTDEYGGFVA